VTVSEDWPVALRGITESIVTTLGPNERWNVAALGLHADTEQGVTARTWGRTRTWRNFVERGEGYVQFTRDPELFVDAALTIHEVDDPVLSSADAWVKVETEKREQGEDGGTQWVEWALSPVDQQVDQRVVPTFNRGYAAVIEATVHASRLDVDAYDTETLRRRIEYCESVVKRCGGASERRAIETVIDIVEDQQ
jgi:hypothetical protein